MPNSALSKPAYSPGMPSRSRIRFTASSVLLCAFFFSTCALVDKVTNGYLYLTFSLPSHRVLRVVGGRTSMPLIGALHLLPPMRARHCRFAATLRAVLSRMLGGCSGLGLGAALLLGAGWRGWVRRRGQTCWWLYGSRLQGLLLCAFKVMLSGLWSSCTVRLPEDPNRLVKGIACLGPGYDTRGPCHGREGTEGTLTVHVTTPTVMVAALPFT